MADQKNHQAQYPSAASTAAAAGVADLESATEQSKQLQRKRVNLCVAFLVVFLLVQTAVVVALDQTIMRAQSPKYRLSSAAIEHLNFTNSPPSFNLTLDGVYAVKNPNFWSYGYLDTYITFSYRGKRVGEAPVAEARAKALSTKRVGFKLNLTSGSGSNLGPDVGSGVLVLTVRSEMRGQVEVLKVIKKDKYPDMDCVVTIDLVGKLVRDLQC